MLRFAPSLLLLILLAALAPATRAEPPHGGREPLRQWQQIPPEERREIRQQLREHWSERPHQRAEEAGERRGDGFRRMPREDRMRLRDELREQRNEWIEHPERHPRDLERRPPPGERRWLR